MPEIVGLGDGRIVEALGIGTIQLKMLFKVSNPKQGVLRNVLHVPKLTCNLFFVRIAPTDLNGFSTDFSFCTSLTERHLCGFWSLIPVARSL